MPLLGRCQSLSLGFDALTGLLGLFLFGLGSLDVADGLLHRTVGIGKYLLCLLTGGAEYFKPFALEFGGELLVFSGHFGQEIVGHLQLGFLPCNLLFVEFDLLQLVFEVEHFASHLLACSLEHLFGEPYILGYFESERAAGMANGESVEGAHLLGVEKHGTVLYAWTLVGQQFEVGIVGGYHSKSMTAVQLLEQGFGNGATRTGFCAPA